MYNRAILINVFIGFFQKKRANSALNKLKSMIERHALVIRDGQKKEIPAAEIVVGDILVLRRLFYLADGRLLKSND
jgi:P-type E1-E2 ATPase